jgi:hypothetical protein
MKFAIKRPPSYRGLITSTGFAGRSFLFLGGIRNFYSLSLPAAGRGIESLKGYQGRKGGEVMETRKEFLEAVMKMANLKDLKQADAASRAVISLTKTIIGEELSQKIAEVSPPDLREGWESIRAATLFDDYERDELLFETGEVSEG